MTTVQRHIWVELSTDDQTWATLGYEDLHFNIPSVVYKVDPSKWNNEPGQFRFLGPRGFICRIRPDEETRQLLLPLRGSTVRLRVHDGPKVLNLPNLHVATHGTSGWFYIFLPDRNTIVWQSED